MSTNKKTTIGVVIADDNEYLPILEKFGATEWENKLFRGFSVENDSAKINCILCGIGKINATMAAVHLLENGADAIFNLGLSGGISTDISGFVFGTRFLETDFDLTPLGFPLAQKPGESLFVDVFEKDEYAKMISKKVSDFLDGKLLFGTFTTADSFIADSKTSRKFKEDYDAIACDMESGAIARVCLKYDVPFVSIRKVSDGANEDSVNDYKEMNDKKESDLADILFNLFETNSLSMC